jgi:hypothetical protein
VVGGGTDDPRVVDIATYRNGMVNPKMMVERAQAKRDAIDTTKAALDGLKIGLLYVGPAIGIGTGDVSDAVANYGTFCSHLKKPQSVSIDAIWVFLPVLVLRILVSFVGNTMIPSDENLTPALLGGGLGCALAVNNYMGKGVHVPDVPEATNRIVVDFSEGVLKRQDVGFVAVMASDDDIRAAETKSPDLLRTYEPTNGVMATVDAQLRNSAQSHPGVRKVPNLPPHLHIKNMDVHYKMRRQGVAKALMGLVIEYALNETDAKALTL